MASRRAFVCCEAQVAILLLHESWMQYEVLEVCVSQLFARCETRVSGCVRALTFVRASRIPIETY